MVPGAERAAITLCELPGVREKRERRPNPGWPSVQAGRHSLKDPGLGQEVKPLFSNYSQSEGET